MHLIELKHCLIFLVIALKIKYNTDLAEQQRMSKQLEDYIGLAVMHSQEFKIEYFNFFSNAFVEYGIQGLHQFDWIPIKGKHQSIGIIYCANRVGLYPSYIFLDDLILYIFNRFH